MQDSNQNDQQQIPGSLAYQENNLFSMENQQNQKLSYNNNKLKLQNNTMSDEEINEDSFSELKQNPKRKNINQKLPPLTPLNINITSQGSENTSLNIVNIETSNNLSSYGNAMIENPFNLHQVKTKNIQRVFKPLQEIQLLQRNSGMEKLKNCAAIFIKQKFDFRENITGCETVNNYSVYEADKNLKACEESIFKCKQSSSFFQRNCLSGDCRPFQMDVEHSLDNQKIDLNTENNNNNFFLRIIRECNPTFLCFARPVIKIFSNENGVQTYFGKVVSKWNLFKIHFEVYDKENRNIYKIEGNSCQLGFCCNCPCDKCGKIQLNVKATDGGDFGEIIKVQSGIHKEFQSECDNFYCKFPENATPIQKSLLLGAVLYIDYIYFETSPGDDKRQFYQIITVVFILFV